VLINAVGAWAMAFLDWIVPMIPPMLRHLWDFVSQLLVAVGEALPGIIEALATWVAAFVDWLIQVGPTLLPEFLRLIEDILSWIVEYGPRLVGQLGTWALAFVSWVAETTPDLIMALGTMLGEIILWIIEHREEIVTTLITWITQFAIWLENDAWPAVRDAFTTFFNEMWAYLTGLWDAAFAEGSIGRALLDGIKTGIQQGWADFSLWFTNKFAELMPDWVPGGERQREPGRIGPEPPGRALGGNVIKGLVYTIGERGKEYFIAPENGRILPNNVVRQAEQARDQTGLARGLEGRSGLNPGDLITRLASQAIPDRTQGPEVSRALGTSSGVQIGSMPLALNVDVGQMGGSQADVQRLVNQMRTDLVPEIYEEIIDAIKTVIRTAA
jgi:hypothetical protein